jgi:hypothetical protein
MPLSILQQPSAVEWPLGFVAVANNGTPVNIMSRVDANSTNAPGQPVAPGTVARAEYTPTCHKIFFQGYKPGNNNNGMIPNTGNVYILRSLGPNNQNAGGPMNRTDSGAMVYVLPPGGFATLPADEADHGTISPYAYTLDADVDGEGALTTLVGCSRG